MKPIEARRREVLVAAARMLDHRGPGEVTIDELATNAGYSRSTIYNYFPGWRHIVTAIVATALDGVAQRLAGVSAPTTASLVEQLGDAWLGGDERALVIAGLRLRDLPWLATATSTASNRCEAAIAHALREAGETATAPGVVLDLLKHQLARPPNNAPPDRSMPNAHR